MLLFISEDVGPVLLGVVLAPMQLSATLDALATWNEFPPALLDVALVVAPFAAVLELLPLMPPEALWSEGFDPAVVLPAG
jgi:hypothetical protein